MKTLAEVCGVYELHIINETWVSCDHTFRNGPSQTAAIERCISDIKMLKTFSYAENKSLSSIHISFSYILHTSV